MHALLCVLLAAPLLGCGEPEAARVVCLDIGVAEGRHPCEVALLLENDGGAAAEVIAADLLVG